MSDKQQQLHTVAAKLGIGTYGRHVLLAVAPELAKWESRSTNPFRPLDHMHFA